MSRARDRQKKREREELYWGTRVMHSLKQSSPWGRQQCDECHGSGRAADWRERDALGARDEAIGRFQMCRKCGGDGRLRVGMIHLNVTI